MSDALGGAPRPPRPPVIAADAGARGQRLQQTVVQQVTSTPDVGAPVTTRQMVIGVSPSGSPRLSNAGAVSTVGVRLVGNGLQLTSGSPRLVLSMDSQQQQGATSQLQHSWISVSSPTVLTTSPRRQISAPMATPSVSSNSSAAPTVTSSAANSSILRPLPASSTFVTPSPAKRHLTNSPSSVGTTVTATATTAARKRLKLDPEEQDEVPALRRRLLAHKATQLHESKDIYKEYLSELFFLQAGGNMMDYLAWRKRPPTPQYLDFTRSRRLDDDGGELERLGVTPELHVAGPGTTPVAVSKQLPAIVAQLNQQGQIPGRPQGGRHGMVYAPRPSSSSSSPSPSTSLLPAASPLAAAVTTAVATASSTTTAPLVPGGVSLIPSVSGPIIPTSSNTSISSSPSTAVRGSAFSARNSPSTSGPSVPKHTTQRLPVVPSARLHTRQHSISAVYDNSLGSQEQIVEKAKQEAYVMQRVTELQRDGLWSEKRLPKVQEPSRAKAHWDYLLEEMVWLAADFAQERKWKKAAAKKCARMVQKYFQDKAIQAQKAEKTQELRIRKIAACIAKEVKTFWNNVHKLVEYKHQMMLEERRRQALDQHLSYIVDQTEKYSEWLAESMGNKVVGSRPESTTNSVVQSGGTSTPEQRSLSDGEFEPNQSSSDDEETIAKAEAEDAGDEQSEELKLLELESTLPLDDVIKSLPVEVREAVQRGQPASSSLPSTSEGVKEQNVDDDDFTASEEDSSDDEETIQEQEKAEESVDHKKELDDLAEDNNLSMEELLAKYGRSGDASQISDQPSDEDDQNEDESGSSDEGGSEVEEDEESESGTSDKEEEEEDVGLSSLLEDVKGITDMDQLANTVEEYQEYQPTGNTLSSTKVETMVPFLLKHELREYQHVGLEWLVTMYNKRLNGILADEMGLGKTIQTIALLAHLACDKCIWGPHLIVVPTSVMLNWEMEFKKWCPAFKILTYYGTQKERRLKRTGWTKPNAFHVCITSYKLVIQDHQSFRRKKWRYLILDEAQNIKNFRSQRWQLLMNFQSHRRLLLTGTPLQNNLMELWSLMHFLMPDVFQSHKEFKEWFVNPVTGMIEGNSEYNDKIIRRLHKVLRPFLLRRLKTEVERQLPKKYEHVVMCRLSKRQRFLYDDFMSRAKTRETLATGNLLSVINVLMQLRKVCNHPNLFEVRPTISPFQMDSIALHIPSLICYALDYDPNKHVSLRALNLKITELEYTLSAYASHKIRRTATPRRLIEEVDVQPSPPPPIPKGKIKLTVTAQSNAPPIQMRPGFIPIAPGTSPVVKALAGHGATGQGVMLRVTGGSPAQGYSVQLVQRPEGGLRTIPVTSLATSTANTSNPAMASSTTSIATTSSVVSIPATQHYVPVSSAAPTVTRTTPVATLTSASTGQTEASAAAPPLLQRVTRPAGFAQLVQTPTGKHILLTSSPQAIHHAPTVAAGTGATTANTTVLTTGGQRLTVLSKPAAGVITPLNKMLTPQNVNTPVSTSSLGNKPAIRMPPINMTSTPATTQTAGVSTRPQLVTTSLIQQSTTSSGSLKPSLTLSNTPIIQTRVFDPRVLAMAETIKKNKEQPQQPKSIFYLAELEEGYKRDRKEKLACLATVNARRCEACPLYGADLIGALDMMGAPARPNTLFTSFPWSAAAGYIHCRQVQLVASNQRLWTSTDALEDAIFSHEEKVEQLKDIFSRYVMYVPSVNAPRPRLHASHASPSCVWAERRLEDQLMVELSPRVHLLHPVVSAMATQFPDPRLIQYDCGKLQVLEKLLRDLKVNSHRVLIFTQMTRMLDVLEAFLNHQGHIYLRLDGATRVDQRQVLMERFNADKRIFVFILSTRSGGIGVNLTGADTVVFYDSDWNPTMDAQAQDRCHRIGQTRDVHIYRLVSEMTVEENILKKANQKRLLGDLAIEGGNFTTAYFKSSTIQELFNVDVSENDASRRMAEVLSSSAEREKQAKEKEVENASDALNNLENVLAAAEDETDVQAARTARAEAAAELAEFDENIALDDDASPQASSLVPAAAQQPSEELSKAEQEIQGIIEKLTPIERYAMKIVEESESAWTSEQLAAAEAEIEQQKREWELGRLKALQEQQREQEEEEEQKLAENQPNNMLTYTGRDAHSQVWMCCDGKEQMPMWCPPTPPQDDSDVYIDHTLDFLYESSVMSESQLPPVYVRREHKRAREVSIGSEREGRPPLKLRRSGDDSAAAMLTPRSLFDRPTPALIKMRRDLRLQKSRGGNVASNLGRSSSFMGYSLGLPVTSRPQGLTRPTPTASPPESMPEWLIYEDWALLQAVQTLQELTLNLVIVSPGHTPNWDMVADMVNCVSRTHRSPKQCRSRYEASIIPREEGKIQYDPSPKKIKKQKGICKTLQNKGGRVMRTSQQYIQDNGGSFTQLYMERFEMIVNIAHRRTPTIKSRHGNPTLRNPKHATVLAENGINYDSPLSPVDVAQRRHERIAKMKSQQVAAANQQQQEVQQQAAAATTAIKGVMTAVAAASPAGSQSMASSTVTTIPQTSTLVVGLSPQVAISSQQQQTSTLSSSSGTITVTTVSQSQQLSAAVVSVAGGTTVLQTQAIPSQIRGARTTFTVQEMVAAAANANRVSQASGGGLVSVAQLPAMQAQRLAATSLVAGPSSAAVAKANVKGTITTGKTLNQVQLYRQQQVLQQHRQRDQTMKMQQQQQQATVGLVATSTASGTAVVGTVGGQKMSVGVASPGTSTLGVAALQVTHQRSPQQYLKQGAAVVGKQTAIARTMTEVEMNALIKRQQQQQQQKAVAAAVAAGSATGQVAQMQLPGQTLSSSPTSSPQLIPQTVQLKTAMVPGTKLSPATQATQQQIRQLTLHQLQQKKLPQQKATGKTTVPTQVILQGQKTIPTVTMQQLQLFKQATGQVTAGTSTPVLTHTVVTKGGQGAGQTLQRVIPVAAGQQQLKQTFQVVTASPGQTITGRPTNQVMTIDSVGGRQQVSVTLASGLGGNIKMTGTTNVSPAQQQAIISHVAAALQSQHGLTRQGLPGQTLRISAPSLAQVMQQHQQQQQQQHVQQIQVQEPATSSPLQQAVVRQQATATTQSLTAATTATQQKPSTSDQ